MTLHMDAYVAQPRQEMVADLPAAAGLPPAPPADCASAEELLRRGIGLLNGGSCCLVRGCSTAQTERLTGSKTPSRGQLALALAPCSLHRDSPALPLNRKLRQIALAPFLAAKRRPPRTGMRWSVKAPTRCSGSAAPAQSESFDGYRKARLDRLAA